MRFREGDLIEDLNGIIFDVKGLVHPPNRVVAFPRFIPSAVGDRRRGPVRYNKVYSLSARYEWLERNSPQYLIHDEVFGDRICEVPINCIAHHYRPIDRLRKLHTCEQPDSLERDALELVSFLKKSARIAWNAFGISGSILAKLHKPTSDIDLIVYARDNCRRLHSVLKSLLSEEGSMVRPYREEKELRLLFDFRSKDTNMSFEDFVRIESRKVLQGKYCQHDYFIRCIKNWNEINESYGDIKYHNAGCARIRAKVTDTSEAIFTPCFYKIDDITVLDGDVAEPIAEIASFRGRFCEQAVEGEVVVAQGKLEEVRDKKGEEYFRLLLGNEPSDFMVLA
ncbi:MAG TPA: hypothetical protein VK487_04045 [Candidatus Bathyarchaeia archaeon]|nr:hypothetical protein [Candidatus Bathyarchaeia archaeon]